jgi:hypothetical protein
VIALIVVADDVDELVPAGRLLAYAEEHRVRVTGRR